MLLAENDVLERKKYYVGIRGIRSVLYCINKLLNFYFATSICSLETPVKRVYGPISYSNRPSLPKILCHPCSWRLQRVFWIREETCHTCSNCTSLLIARDYSLFRMTAFSKIWKYAFWWSKVWVSQAKRACSELQKGVVCESVTFLPSPIYKKKLVKSYSTHSTHIV